jgi:tetratricopeptide (TPR) repeat protein
MNLGGVLKASRTALNVVVGASLAALIGASGGCSRSHIEAIDKANEGDQAVKVNVSAAISKYEEAIRLDPANHRILWKLAMAYEKQEEWSKMESTLSQALSQAPTFAEYAYYRGYALIRIAEGGNKEAYEDAKAPLKKCIEADPNYAECYHWLGQAFLWTDDDQSALDNYSKAIERDPKVGYFYPPLAELYINLRMYDAAEKVLSEGDKLLEKVQKNKNALYAIYTLQSNVFQAKKADNERLAALERANDIGGDSHPEVAFNLGSTYATMKPPQKDKAVRLLKSFNKRACKSQSAQTKYKDQCEISNALVSKLGGGE